MSEERKAAKLDLSGFKPRAPMTLDPIQEREALEQGKRLGFTSRAEVPKIDGRTLRKRGKSQMNMRLSPVVQHDLKIVVSEFADADACIAHMLELYRQSQRR
jgi:hypothetical protein